YAGFSLEEMYGWTLAGMGSGATQPAADALNTLAPMFEQSSDILRTELRTAGVSWQGQAATQAGDNLRRVADWARITNHTSRVAGNQVEQYGESWARARANIPKPIAEGHNSTAGQFVDLVFDGAFGVQSDYRKRLAANRAAHQTAIDALDSHQRTTQDILNA